MVEAAYSLSRPGTDGAGLGSEGLATRDESRDPEGTYNSGRWEGEGHGSGRVSAHILHACLEFFVVFCVGVAPGVWGRSRWCRLTGLFCLLGCCAGQGQVERSCGAFPPRPLILSWREAPSSLSLPLIFFLSELLSVALAPSIPSAQFPFSDQLSVLRGSFPSP